MNINAREKISNVKPLKKLFAEATLPHSDTNFSYSYVYFI